MGERRISESLTLAIGLVLIFGAVYAVLARYALDAFPYSGDEYSLALQGELFAKGLLKAPAPPHIEWLRVDHVDGLLNPKQYFQRLRAGTSGAEPVYLVVEKILARHERLREDWPLDGTTGYEFANLVLGLLIDPAGEAPLTQIYSDFTGERRSFQMAREAG